MQSNSSSNVRVRSGGRVVPVRGGRPWGRFPFADTVTYLYAIGALLGTAVAQNLAGSLWSQVHLH
jgi:hypothetical protein